MCLAQGPQHSDAGEAWTRGLSVSSQALYHWATAIPEKVLKTSYIRYKWETSQPPPTDGHVFQGINYD